jgi:hypothetical protein
MTTTKTAPSGSLIRAMALVWLNKAGPLDALGLHAKVDTTLQEHGYAPVALSQVSTALSSLNAQSLIKPHEGDGTKYDAAEDGNDLLVHTLTRMDTNGRPDGYAVACILSQEARV